MGSFFLYVLKSTFCIGLLYLVFRMVMRKEIFFALNRVLLLAVVISSTLIPLINLPKVIQPEIQQKLIPAFPEIKNTLPELPVVADAPQISRKASVAAEKPESAFPVVKTIGYIYIAGMLFTFLVFIHGIATILFMLRKAKAIRKDGYLVFILKKDIPAFSFCKMIFISRSDYLEHGKTILTHEIQHIRLGHFYDLMLMEIIKMIHWFNPVIYWLIQDLKAIHEFQADRHTLTKGIDANKYQLLIIEKGVGSQKFALANSFNHCQIKKRITMMNKQMTSKAGIWKVATFLPLLALLLMAFGRTGENVQTISPSERNIPNQLNTNKQDSSTQSKETVYNTVQVMPQFPAGDKGLRGFIAKNVQYPKEAETKRIQGKVSVQFIVNKEGKVTNAKVTKSVDPALDAEALRVIRSMPNWTPGKQDGKTVSVYITTPILFTLQ